MVKDIKVSVIIPFHNSEEFVEDTMNCILSQTLQEIEIICVDDESTDGTLLKLKKYEKDDSRVRIFQQKKANAGVARNLGMQQAIGKYLVFLDSDDLFETEMLKKMYEKCEETDSDLCICDANQYNTVTGEYLTKPQYLRKQYLPPVQSFSKKDIGKYILYFTNLAPWNKMLRREFLLKNDIAFQNIERANDQFFSCISLVLANKICVVDEVLVHYRIGQESNLTTHFASTPLCSLEAMTKVRRRLEQEQLWEDRDIRCAFDNKVVNSILYSLNIQNTVEGYRELYVALKDWGLEQLGVELKEENYYLDSLEYRNLVYLLQYDYDMYLLVKNKEYRETIARKNYNYKNMVSQKNDIIAQWKVQAKEYEKELKDIKRKNWYQKITRFIDWYHLHFKREKLKDNKV